MMSDEKENYRILFGPSGLGFSKAGPDFFTGCYQDSMSLPQGAEYWEPETAGETWPAVSLLPEQAFGSLYPIGPLGLDSSALCSPGSDQTSFDAGVAWAGSSLGSGSYGSGSSARPDDTQAPYYCPYVDSLAQQQQSNNLPTHLYYGDAGIGTTADPLGAQSLIASPDSAATQSLSSTADLATAQAGRPGKDKEGRKRGRPRLYDADGTRRDRGPPSKPSQKQAAVTAGRASAAVAAPGAPGAVYDPLNPADQAPTERTSDGRSPQRSSHSSPDDLVRIRARNKVAATRYRLKTQASIARAEEEEREAAAKRQVLLACAGQLQEEVFQLKNEVLHQAGCGCPMMQDYLSKTARGYGRGGGGQGDRPREYQSLGPPPPPPLPAGIGEDDSLLGSPQGSSQEDTISHEIRLPGYLGRECTATSTC